MEFGAHGQHGLLAPKLVMAELNLELAIVTTPLLSSTVTIVQSMGIHNQMMGLLIERIKIAIQELAVGI